MPDQPYIGRFAPSPTGPLHAGSLVAALASWLHARAHGGQWLVRIEDVDTPRCIPGMAEHILRQLHQCGLHSDGPVIFQSQRGAAYESALSQLQCAQLAYPCTCSRAKIAQHFEALGMAKERFSALPYPGFCRDGAAADPARTSAWRLLTSSEALRNPFFASNQPSAGVFSVANATDIVVTWTDERLGTQQQNLSQEVGDFVLKRADGLWAYQLAVVVDDAAQGITHVVRGADLADNTPRQIWLQQCLGLPTPRYLHTPLVLAADGQKLSKQNGAQSIEVATPAAATAALQAAGTALQLPFIHASSPAQWLTAAAAHYTAARS